MKGTVLNLSLFVALAASSLLPPLRYHGLSSFSIDHDHVSLEIPSQSVDIFGSQGPKGILLKRAPPNAGPVATTSGYGWVVKYRKYYNFIIPVHVAASVLEEFYTECLRRIALEEFLKKPGPGNGITFNLGSVFLALKIGDPTKGIEWWGCRIIIEELLENVRQGFTAQFRSEWVHAESGTFVSVSLSMLQRIGLGLVGDDN